MIAGTPPPLKEWGCKHIGFALFSFTFASVKGLIRPGEGLIRPFKGLLWVGGFQALGLQQAGYLAACHLRMNPMFCNRGYVQHSYREVCPSCICGCSSVLRELIGSLLLILLIPPLSSCKARVLPLEKSLVSACSETSCCTKPSTTGSAHWCAICKWRVLQLPPKI